MIVAVPAVSVSTISPMLGAVNVSRERVGQAGAARVEQEHDAGRLQDRQHDRDVARVLVDLLDADLTLVLQRLQLGITTVSSCMMIELVM